MAVKSTPVTADGAFSWVFSLGNGTGSGALNAAPDPVPLPKLKTQEKAPSAVISTD